MLLALGVALVLVLARALPASHTLIAMLAAEVQPQLTEAFDLNDPLPATRHRSADDEDKGERITLQDNSYPLTS